MTHRPLLAKKDSSLTAVHRRIKSPLPEITARKNNESTVRVALRTRPLNTNEAARGDASIFRFPSNNNRTEMQVVSASAGGRELVRSFHFDVCASAQVTQKEFFELCGITALLDSALEGYLATVFAYGQTGSGKTYSMSGLEEKLEKKNLDNRQIEETSDGLIPRTIRYLFKAIQTQNTAKYTLKASYCEIYNEQAYDLLNPASGSLNIRWNDHNGFYVQNLLVVQCDSIDDIMAVVDEGHRNRRVGSHEMNNDSSRSHSILTLLLDQEVVDPNDGHAVMKYGKISFVDLAGSERLRDTKSSNTEETSSINKSLMTLGKVISALGTKSTSQSTAFVPYRDSKLTKLLMDSLGGNSLTLMVACISPAPCFMEDTLSTLNYATRAKNIQNKPTIQTDPKESLIAGLRQENQLLRSENALLKQQLQSYGGSTSVTNLPGTKAPRQLAALNSKPSNGLPEKPDPELVNGVVSAYQSQLIYLQQENAQLHANNGYSEHRLANLTLENEALQLKLESYQKNLNVQTTIDRLMQENKQLKAQLQGENDTDILEQVRQMNQRLEQLQQREQELMMALARKNRSRD
ncbi:kinesin [Thraustotheca clavata]|uniref:Kinesin-like protein n=1 Tax=Thraustotheca clavata TaxID=74557 RepID=A0A1V9ZAW8_9STRA|nr:kinesin [Thraustotheca clavata]